MPSPAPVEVMGIDNMLNQRGAMSAAPQLQGIKTEPHHTLQPLAQLGMDRADSPHGSEHSRYSAPGLNGLDTRVYGSPSAMHADMGLPPPNMAPGMVLSSMAPAMGQGLQQPPMQAHQPPPKAYPCSSCGKGFARRSDLARHGNVSLKM